MNRFLKHISILICLLPAFAGKAQGPMDRLAETILSEDYLSSQVEFLTDTLCSGRATGTRGGVEASFWLVHRFRQYRLLPFPAARGPRREAGQSPYVRSFVAGEKVGHNVLGFSPATKADAGYVLITAHYDNLGVLAGRMYPGADSNASGVAALLGLARSLRSISVMGLSSSKNIIFAALDAKQLSMAGSQALRDEIASGRLADPVTGHVISLDDIELMINLDILGGTLEPVTKGREDYLIMLSADDSLKRRMAETNFDTRLHMDLGFDYYGSADFTDLFLNRIGDQKPFIESGVPAVLFTSGITMDTNKVSDVAASLNIPVFRKRVLLIFRWLESLFS